MENEPIQLLQFFVCEDFEFDAEDGYKAEKIRSNLYVASFPAALDQLYVVTCWKKDQRFHKEVIEYQFENEPVIKTPHMDIEPVTNHVLFRWHKHRFPSNLEVKKDSLLHIRVILDWDKKWETYLMIEKRA
jgi:hypothetical protein